MSTQRVGNRAVRFNAPCGREVDFAFVGQRSKVCAGHLISVLISCGLAGDEAARQLYGTPAWLALVVCDVGGFASRTIRSDCIAQLLKLLSG